MLDSLDSELKRRIRQDCYSTAFPWKPEDWAQYKQPGGLSFKPNGRLSFYIHIPFCKNICKFCEYTRCLVPDDIFQRNYLRILHNDIRKFLIGHPCVTLEGFDIGGGTPSALSPTNFAYLMQIYKEVIHRINVSDDFEPSIEMSVTTLHPEKIRMIKEAGIRRISIGIQHGQFERFHGAIGWVRPDARKIIEDIRMIRNYGNFKINLDFMYGFKELNVYEAINSERNAIEELNPDQVTLYELRTNQNQKVKATNSHWRFQEYEILYQMLTDLGYLGQFGQNTFSSDRYDFGVSSYIRNRMLDGGDYKGFGISAQSMSGGNVEYNVGKNSSDLMSLIPAGKIPGNYSFEATGHYELPVREKFAKFVCISGYSGGFNWRIAKEKYYPDFFERFGSLIDFLIGAEYVVLTDTRINLTRKGFQNYGAVLSLFYKPQHFQAQ